MVRERSRVQSSLAAPFNPLISLHAFAFSPILSKVLLQNDAAKGRGAAGEIRNPLYRNGGCYARLVAPKELRPKVGKTELRIPLGADRREALRKRHGAVGKLLDVLTEARKSLEASRQPTRRLSSKAELAHALY